jgi:ribosomal-protein-alanine N-acetyltransferase
LKENNNSEKVMIKLGMKKEGELRKHQYHEGKWKDRLLYGLIKEEYDCENNHARHITEL